MQDAAQPTGTVKRRFEFRGAAAALYNRLNPPHGSPAIGAEEILLEGPAGTGKTTAVLGIVAELCARHPGVRVLFLRETRKSLNESVLRTFEELVLPPGSPVLTSSTASRDHRDKYEFPSGSIIVPGSMENIERYRSSEWDIIVVFEATEIKDEDDWQKLLRALRAKGLPNNRRFIIADTNPDHPMHWLNRRADSGKMVRIKAKHTDNPLYFTDTGDMTDEGRAYMATLGNMTGHVRARLLEGLWVAAEGMIWPEWHPATHVVQRSLLLDRAAFRQEHATVHRRVMWYAAGMDWGYYPGAGTCVIGAVDDRKRVHIVHEEYRVKRDINEWIAVVKSLLRRYPVQVIAADPAEPGYIDMFRAEALPIRPADNDVTAGIAAVRHRLKPQERFGGTPGLFYVDGALETPDPVLQTERRATGFLDEVWQYCYRPYKAGEPIREEPDPRCADHAADAVRYLCRAVDRFDFAGSVSEDGWPEGSYGAHDNMPEWGWRYMPGVVRGEQPAGATP